MKHASSISFRAISLSLALAFLSSCGSSSDESNKSVPQESNSARQLRLASYSSETERAMLAKFRTGSDFCKKFESITSKENGFYVTVPVDYSDFSKGTTKIWAFFSSGAFKPELPTMIYFDGGSGGNSHESPKTLKNFNELHYDQRGIGCSSPESLDLYRNPSFYSNENNAKDANEIRKSLKIEKVSLLGTSYGTVVANVFGSLFPNNTTAVVLDGVVFGDDKDYKVVGFYLRKMYAKLPEDTKAAMRSYFSDESKIYRIWTLARLLMYSNKPFETLSTLLIRAFPNSYSINYELATKLFDPSLFDKTFFGDDISAVEGFNNAMLNCKNKSFTDTINLALFGTMDGKLKEFEKYDYVSDSSKECAVIGVTTGNQHIYSADHYPIQVPITYFQGNEDGATFADGAIKHFKTVPTSHKQILIAVKGGHCPGYSAVIKKYSSAVTIMEKALLGQKIEDADVAALNKEQSDVHWVFTTKYW